MHKSTTTISDGSDAEDVDAAQDAPAQEQTGTAEETDWKAEARKWEGRAKANSAAAKRLAEIEESEKTELQKLQDRVKKAEDAAAAATALAERMKLAASTGVPAELLAGPGDDPEAYARAIKEWRDKAADSGSTGAQQDGASAAERARVLSRVGRTPDRRGAVSIAEQIAAAEKAGDRHLAMSLKVMQLGGAQ